MQHDEPLLRLFSLSKVGIASRIPLSSVWRLSGLWEAYGAIFEQHVCFWQACADGEHVPVCFLHVIEAEGWGTGRRQLSPDSYLKTKLRAPSHTTASNSENTWKTAAALYPLHECLWNGLAFNGSVIDWGWDAHTRAHTLYIFMGYLYIAQWI